MSVMFHQVEVYERLEIVPFQSFHLYNKYVFALYSLFIVKSVGEWIEIGVEIGSGL